MENAAVHREGTDLLGQKFPPEGVLSVDADCYSLPNVETGVDAADVHDCLAAIGADGEQFSGGEAQGFVCFVEGVEELIVWTDGDPPDALVKVTFVVDAAEGTSYFVVFGCGFPSSLIPCWPFPSSLIPCWPFPSWLIPCWSFPNCHLLIGQIIIQKTAQSP